MSKPTEKYRVPPKKVFRAMGLGKLADGHVKVVAGFQYKWWDPQRTVTPLFVDARVLRVRVNDA